MYTCSWDKAYVRARRGDAAAPSGKPRQLGVFDGMFDHTDPRNVGWTELPVFSDFYLSEVLVVEVDRSLLPDLVAGTAQINQPAIDLEGETSEPIPSDYRFTTKYIDWDVLEPFVVAQCPDFKNLLYEKGAKIPVLKVPFFPMTAFKDSTTIDVNRDPSLRPEVGALLPGNYTTGVAGAYLTFGGAAGAYVANNAGGAMAGNVTMTEISNIVETATALSTQALGGFTWLTTSNNPHYGNPLAGWQIQINFSAATMFDLRQDNNGVMEIEHLRLQWIAAYDAANHMIFDPAGQITVAAGTQYVYVHDIMGDGNDRTDMGVNFGANPVTVDCYNCVMWDCFDRGIGAFSTGGTILLENNATYSCDTRGFAFSGAAGFGVTCRDCTAYDNGTDYVNTAAHTGRYNVSSDGTAANVLWAVGVGNRINGVVLNDVQSVNDGLGVFFDIIVGGPLDSAGEANTGQRAVAAACIRNRVVPNAGGFTSVGPAEIPVPVAPTPTVRAVNTTQSHIAMPAGVGMF